MNCIKDKPNNDGNIVDLIIPHLESSWLVATISKKQNVWNSTNIQINVDLEEKVGKYFELDKINHVIKILHNCEALVSASAFFDSTEGDSYAWLKINKNNTVVASKLERIINRNFPQASIAAKPISLKKDDTLKLVVEYGGTTGNPSIRASKYVTFLAITKI